MRRREFIPLLGGAVATWSFSARAQQPTKPVVGFLNPNSSDAYPEAIAAFRAGLREYGYIEGKNITIAYRWGNGHEERMPALTADLLRIPVNVIAATGGGAAAFAAKAATTTIPIVFNSADDPVKTGLVASLDRPGGNLTGVSRLSVELMPKRLELLHEIAPDASTIPYLVGPYSSVASSTDAQAAGKNFGIELQVVNVTADTDLEKTFRALVSTPAKALLIGSSAYFNSHSKQLGELCLRFKLPAIYQQREFVEAGGLVSYGPSLSDAYRIVGEYTGRVLQGARPADLPVQQQTKIDLIVNLKTAKAIGLAFPPALLARADEVIE
jgi:putative tryptophan/tyrosine transport system substrate-binding protein